MNILNVLIVGLMCVLGIGSSLGIVGYMIVILIQKIYRKIRYGTPLTK